MKFHRIFNDLIVEYITFVTYIHTYICTQERYALFSAAIIKNENNVLLFACDINNIININIKQINIIICQHLVQDWRVFFFFPQMAS